MLCTQATAWEKGSKLQHHLVRHWVETVELLKGGVEGAVEEGFEDAVEEGSEGRVLSPHQASGCCLGLDLLLLGSSLRQKTSAFPNGSIKGRLPRKYGWQSRFASKEAAALFPNVITYPPSNCRQGSRVVGV